MSVTIEQAFKQVLEAAIHQVKYKRFEREPDNDPVEAFIEDLFAVLFPQQQAAQAVQTVTVPTVAATVTVAAAPEKPKRGRKPKAAAPAPEAAPAPAPEQTNEAPKKRGRKPKAAAEAAPAEEEAAAPKKNLEKLTATNKKHIKKWADEVGVTEEPDTKALLAHVNAMSAEEFNGATFEQHVKSFLQPKEEEANDGDELEEYEFNGKTYYVNKETDRIYEQRGEAYVAVGYIGMAAFAEMKKD